MGTLMVDDSSETDKLLNRARKGDEESLNELFERFRDRLRRMVESRLDRRLKGRIDPSDVLQEVFFEAAQRLDSYLAKPSMPLFLWLRFLVGERLVTLHRSHLGTRIRDAARELSLYSGPLPAASSAALTKRSTCSGLVAAIPF